MSCLIASFLIYSISSPLQADRERHREGDDDHRGGHRYRGKKQATAPVNPTYQNICGGCHFPYPPGLLPTASWNKIIDRLKDHFGEDIPCDPKEQQEIRIYLQIYGADRASWKKSSKIMRSLQGKSPLRITEVPYIQSKHRKISADVFKRQSIGSLSNCRACHTTADKGDFNDDKVIIPN